MPLRRIHNQDYRSEAVNERMFSICPVGACGVIISLSCRYAHVVMNSRIRIVKGLYSYVIVCSSIGIWGGVVGGCMGLLWGL